jgi:hypothetical protein
VRKDPHSVDENTHHKQNATAHDTHLMRVFAVTCVQGRERERMIWRAVVPQYAIESCIVSIKQRTGLFRYRIHHRKPRESREHRVHSQQETSNESTMR